MACAGARERGKKTCTFSLSEIKRFQRGSRPSPLGASSQNHHVILFLGKRGSRQVAEVGAKHSLFSLHRRVSPVSPQGLKRGCRSRTPVPRSHDLTPASPRGPHKPGLPTAQSRTAHPLRFVERRRRQRLAILRNLVVFLFRSAAAQAPGLRHDNHYLEGSLGAL